MPNLHFCNVSQNKFVSETEKVKSRDKWWVFNRSQTMGILALVMLIGVSIGLKSISPSLIYHFEPIDTTNLSLILKDLKGRDTLMHTPDVVVPSADTFETFLFDPNSISSDSLELFGFSKHLSTRFFKFRNAVDGFSSKEQVLELYGLSQSLKDRLDSCIVLVDRQEVDNPADHSDKHQTEVTRKWEPYPKKKEWPLLNIELNTADTSDLKAIYGIGSVRARQIVKFRDALGGFTHVK